jgi:outer membrane protein insertion porin family
LSCLPVLVVFHVLAGACALSSVFAAVLAFPPPAHAEEARRVTSVDFAPADRVGSYRYADLVAVRAGDPLTPDLIERNLRLLRATGLFNESAARLVEQPGGAAVQFTLQPYLLVKDVRVAGNVFVLESDLARMVRLRSAEPFNDAIVRGDVERMRRHYEEQGFEDTAVAAEVSPEAGEVRVTYRIDEGRPRVVRTVVLRGNHGLREGELLGALGISRYTFFRGADLQSGLEKLRDYYQRRGYLDVRVGSQVEASDGSMAFLAMLTNPLKGLLSLGHGGYRFVTVTVEIDEGRRFEASFRGVNAFSERELRQQLTFQRSGFFDEEEVAAGRERILAYYQERGYYLAEVDAKADYDTGQVVYTVRENRPVLVGEVRLVGFTHFGEAWIRQRLGTISSGGDDTRVLQASQLERDQLRILTWYRNEGYTQVEVPPPEVWPEAGPSGAVVVFSVHEGPRSLVRSISFAGATALPTARLLEAAGLRAGEPFRSAELQQAVDRVRGLYTHAGYPQCVVTARPDFSEDRTRVDFRFTVAEGRLQRLGRVVVTGNGRTAQRVVLRELPVAPGDPFDPEALAKGKTAIYDLGLFREVRYALPEPTPDGPQDLVVAVRERPTGFVGFGAGYASDEHFRGFVEAGEQSLFGSGRGLRWKTKLSELGYRNDLFYLEPWLLDYHLQGQVDLYLESRKETGYQVQRQGLALGVNHEFTPRLQANLRYRYEFVNYSNVVPDLTAELGPLESFKIASLALSLEYDLRDNPISPRRGSFHVASAELARPLLGGDASFTKYQLETSWYLPLGSGAEFALGLRGGFTQLVLNAGDLPLSERFFLGGDRSVRGYRYKGIGPKDEAGNPLGGNVFAQGSLELRVTLYKKLRGVLFCDAGELWADQAGLPASGVKTAAGAGVRYETLIGPIRLDWGHKLNPEPGESRSRWHLTIGYPF